MNLKVVVPALASLALISQCAWSEVAGKSDPATHYFQQISEQAAKGDLRALQCLGDLYETGTGTAQNSTNALAAYQAAADKGDLESKKYVFAQELYGGSIKGLADLHALVDSGYLPAATIIGDAYAYGLAVPKNMDEALHWYEKAAEAGDGLGQIRLGELYSYGEGVKRDGMRAKYWLEKAADVNSDCLGTFIMQSSMIIKAYYHAAPTTLPSHPERAHTTGPLGIEYVYDNRRATKVTLISSSGVSFFDEGMLQATRAATLPPWPKSFVTDDKTIRFWIVKNQEGLDPEFKKKVDAAIDAAKQFPEYVLINGSTGTGYVVVSFDYLDGKVTNAKIDTSSNDKYEDTAALNAVNQATYPPPLNQYKGHSIHMSITINFWQTTPSRNPATTSAPAATTKY